MLQATIKIPGIIIIILVSSVHENKNKNTAVEHSNKKQNDVPIFVKLYLVFDGVVVGVKSATEDEKIYASQQVKKRGSIW